MSFKGYKGVLGPETLQFDPMNPGRRIRTPADYLGWHTRVVTTRGVEPWDSKKKTKARVNHGRWIADCVWCGGGMLTRPDWGVAYCASCGARYHRKYVVFPRDFLRISKALLVRVRRDQQNWDDRQKPEDLELENERPDVMTVEDVDRENKEIPEVVRP